MQRMVVALSIFMMAGPLVAQGPAFRVKDIKTESPIIEIPWPRAYEQQAWEGQIYFGAEDGIHGNEIWRWSPSSGPELFADICPGEWASSPYELTPHDGFLYFTAIDADHGRELWRTDGTEEGTLLVIDLRPGVEGSEPAFLTSGSDGRIYFSAASGVNGDRELWASDGSAAGTYRVADILAGPMGSDPTSLVWHDGALFFTADDGLHGRELWTSDGTGAGTSLVEDLCPGEAGCFWQEGWYWMGRLQLASAENGLLLVMPTLGLLPDDSGPIERLTIEPNYYHGFAALDGARVFDGCDQQAVCNVWRSDGTSAGTYALSAITQTTSSPTVALVGVAGDWVYFVAADDGDLQLWRSDGLPGPPELVGSLGPTSEDGEGISTQPGIAIGERLFFAVSTGLVGKEPWVTDGTADGTFLLADIFPGELGSFSLWFPQRLAAVDGRVVFFAAHPDDDFPLWSSDLSVEGTRRVADLDTQVSSMPTSYRHGSDLRGGAFAGRLLFGADDSRTGIEPWITDGTEEGTNLLADLEPGGSGETFPDSSDPQSFLAAAGVAIVSGYTGLWATDGTTGGTVRLADDGLGMQLFTRPGTSPSGATEIYVSGGTLTVTDGTLEGTVPLESNVGEGRPIVSEGSIFLTRYDPIIGEEVWKTPGGPGEAKLLEDIYPGPESSRPRFLGTLGGTVLFGANDGSTGRELWRTESSPAGAELLLDINPDTGSDPKLPDPDHRPAVLAGRLYFTADDGTHGRELWSSDGTRAGSGMVFDINPGAVPSDPSEIVVAGRRIFFFANDDTHGRELWVFDAGSRRPRLVKDIARGPASTAPVLRIGRRILAVGNRVYFAAADGETGVELWTSDGTFSGTRRLQDINPGPGSSSPSNFIVAGDCLYFSANDGTTGFELWALLLGPRLSPNDHGCAPRSAGHAPVFNRR